MASLSHLLTSFLQNTEQKLLLSSLTSIACTRNASKKASGSSRNPPRNPKPKHRRWHVGDGKFVTAGKILVTQNKLRFHPGLNVGMGKNGTLFAIEAGNVVVTCEEFDPDWTHTWVQRHYSGRQEQIIYKKYYNIIPVQQHNRFKLIDKI